MFDLAGLRPLDKNCFFPHAPRGTPRDWRDDDTATFEPDYRREADVIRGSVTMNEKKDGKAGDESLRHPLDSDTGGERRNSSLLSQRLTFLLQCGVFPGKQMSVPFRALAPSNKKVHLRRLLWLPEVFPRIPG